MKGLHIVAVPGVRGVVQHFFHDRRNDLDRERKPGAGKRGKSRSLKIFPLQNQIQSPAEPENGGCLLQKENQQKKEHIPRPVSLAVEVVERQQKSRKQNDRMKSVEQREIQIRNREVAHQKQSRENRRTAPHSQRPRQKIPQRNRRIDEQTVQHKQSLRKGKQGDHRRDQKIRERIEMSGVVAEEDRFFPVSRQPEVPGIVLRPVGVGEPEPVERFDLHEDPPSDPEQRSGEQQRQCRPPFPYGEVPVADQADPPDHDHRQKNEQRNMQKRLRRNQQQKQQPCRKQRPGEFRSIFPALLQKNPPPEQREQQQWNDGPMRHKIRIERLEKRRFHPDHVEVKNYECAQQRGDGSGKNQEKRKFSLHSDRSFRDASASRILEEISSGCSP